ncbi:CYTH domain-containing protein [Marmoricola sp. RAF53]
MPGNVPGLHDPRRIEDRYLHGTRLRLRHVQVWDQSVYKLTQKVRTQAHDPAESAITNTYLDRAEYDVFASLPAAVLRKTRSIVTHGTATFAVDVFEGRLAGLVLAEVEVEDLAAPLDLPAWIGREVTRDDRYAGASLANLGASEAQALISG